MDDKNLEVVENAAVNVPLNKDGLVAMILGGAGLLALIGYGIKRHIDKKKTVVVEEVPVEDGTVAQA